VGEGHHNATVEQAEAIAVETDGQRVTVGTVGVNVQGIGGRLPVATIDDGDGDLRPIFGSGEDALRCIEIAVEAAGHLLLLAQNGLVGDDVEFVDGRRRDQ